MVLVPWQMEVSYVSGGTSSHYIATSVAYLWIRGVSVHWIVPVRANTFHYEESIFRTLSKVLRTRLI